VIKKLKRKIDYLDFGYSLHKENEAVSQSWRPLPNGGKPKSKGSWSEKPSRKGFSLLPRLGKVSY